MSKDASPQVSAMNRGVESYNRRRPSQRTSSQREAGPSRKKVARPVTAREVHNVRCSGRERWLDSRSVTQEVQVLRTP